MIDYSSVSQIKEVLDLFHLSMQKKFGQNFLVADRFRKAVAENLKTDEIVSAWEIGPGIGSLTALFPPDKDLTLFEIDYGFIRFLETEFPGRRIIAGDFVKTFSRIAEENGTPGLIYGNLPYCAAAAMIAALIEKAVLPPRMVFMVQKEVAGRMKALPCSRDYSSFTLLCALDYKVRTVFDVPPDAFFPRPEVVSAVVEMVRHNRYAGINRDIYLMLVRAMFRSRRKTLRNNLSSLKNRFSADCLEEAFGRAGIALERRGEEVSADVLSEVVKSLPGGIVDRFPEKRN